MVHSIFGSVFCLLMFTLRQELAEPSIKDAFSLCVQQGANRVVVSPFFLFPGRHWNQVWPCASDLYVFYLLDFLRLLEYLH